MKSNLFSVAVLCAGSGLAGLESIIINVAGCKIFR